MKNIVLKKFTDLSMKHKDMILLWRNDIRIRKYMYNDKIIQRHKHLNFIESLNKDSTQTYFLVTKDNIEIGVIYFKNIVTRNSAELGIYSNPNIKKMGSILLNIICDYAFDVLRIDTLYAEVLFDNVKARDLYTNFNFLEKQSKTINNKKIIIMELKNEDR